MNLRMQKLLGRLYRDAAGEHGDGGSGAGGQGAGDPNASGNAGGAAAGDAGGAAAGGKQGPTDEEARLLKEVMQKKDALNKATADNAALAEKLKQFEGIDPVAVKQMLDDRKAAEEKALEAKGDYDRLKTRMAEEHAKVLTGKDAEIERLKGELAQTKGTVNELSIGSLFSQSKFIGDELTLPPTKARALYGEHFELEDGKVVAYDKPRGDANRTALVDQYGAPVAFDEALRKIVDADPEKDYLFKSKVKAGAGSENKASSSKAVAGKSGAELDSVSKIAAGLKGIKVG